MRYVEQCDNVTNVNLVSTDNIYDKIDECGLLAIEEGTHDGRDGTRLFGIDTGSSDIIMVLRGKIAPLMIKTAP